MTKTGRHLFALCALLVGALLLAACSAPGSPAGAGSSGATGDSGFSGLFALSPGQVQLGDGAETGVVLRHPVDGHLAGDGFSLTITAYGEAGTADGGMQVAPAGYTLAIVDFGLTFPDGAETAPDVALSAGGHLYDLTSTGPLAAGAQNAEAVVPKGEAVSLQASLDGLTQTFSFASGGRVGAAPAVLYRSASGDPEPTDHVGKSVTLPVEDPAASFSSRDELTLRSASLSWFSPVDPAVHPRAGLAGAFLVLALGERTSPEAPPVEWRSAMPPARMSLVLPTGTVLHSDPASTSSEGRALGDEVGLVVGVGLVGGGDREPGRRGGGVVVGAVDVVDAVVDVRLGDPADGRLLHPRVAVGVDREARVAAVVVVRDDDRRAALRARCGRDALQPLPAS